MYIRSCRSARALLLVSGFATLLAACGGGGNDTPPPVVDPGPALTFSPGTVATTFSSGSSKEVAVKATINRPADFNGATTVYAYVTDTTGVILPQVEIAQSGYTFTATLHTAHTLAQGEYSGNLMVKVCRDVDCYQQFPGSPMRLPYKFTVTVRPFSVFHNAPLINTFTIGGPIPPSFNMAVTVGDPSWTATTTAPWIRLSNATAIGNGTVVVSYDFTGLAPGNYSGAIHLRSSGGQALEIPVALTLKPAGA